MLPRRQSRTATSMPYLEGPVHRPCAANAARPARPWGITRLEYRRYRPPRDDSTSSQRQAVGPTHETVATDQPALRAERRAHTWYRPCDRVACRTWRPAFEGPGAPRRMHPPSSKQPLGVTLPVAPGPFDNGELPPRDGGRHPRDRRGIEPQPGHQRRGTTRRRLRRPCSPSTGPSPGSRSAGHDPGGSSRAARRRSSRTARLAGAPCGAPASARTICSPRSARIAA